MSEQSRPVTGIGEYRMLNSRVYPILSSIIKGVRQEIESRVNLNPRFKHDSELTDDSTPKFENPELYYFPDIISEESEIEEALETGWKNLKYFHIAGRKKAREILLEHFNSKEEVIRICRALIEQEIKLIHQLYPMTLQETADSKTKLHQQQQLEISNRVLEVKNRRESEEKIRNLIENDDIEGFADLQGADILKRRITCGGSEGGWGGRSDYPWEDLRLRYNLSKRQLKDFRASRGYRIALDNKCRERRESYKSRNDSYPGSWYNESIIKLAGIPGYTETYF